MERQTTLINRLGAEMVACLDGLLRIRGDAGEGDKAGSVMSPPSDKVFIFFERLNRRVMG